MAPRSIRLACLLVALTVRHASAQTGYYNLDSGRPTRVEDAVPTELRELELQFLPLRGERVGDGTQRFRFEPKIAYGVLPHTEIEMRVPLMDVRAPASPETMGVASAAIGALYALNVETGAMPGVAIAGEWVLPVGSLAAPTGSYSLKALATKTLRFARLQLNLGGGTWSARTTAPSPTGGFVCGNAPGVPPCQIPDVPCDLVPAPGPQSNVAPSFSCAAPSFSLAGSTTPRGTGAHWTAGLGLDHTFPMVSTLLAADIVMDRFEGLYPLSDWTAEVGVRHQLTPQLIADFGIARRFAGTTQSTSVILGITFDAPLRSLLR